jgi:2-alkenal reductase
MLLSGLAGAGLGGAAVYVAVRDQLDATATAAAEAATPAPLPPAVTPEPVGAISTTVTFDTAVTQAVEKVGSAVITVINVSGGGPRGSGSGVIVSPEGLAVTNNHVVEGSLALEVIFRDGATAQATLVGADPVADIAVLKIEGPVPAYAEFGDSELLKPGETVIAIGSPLGDFRNTVTVGVVSATHRSLEGGTGDLIQTDAAINEGNSGGPLVNLAGQVIGINTVVVRGAGGFGGTEAQGLGFAVASSTVAYVADQLASQGYVARPFLGVAWAAVTPEIASANGLGASWGAYVTEVTAGSPAEQAGLRPGDIITGINDETLGPDTSFSQLLYKYAPGDEVTLAFVRDGQTQSGSVTLAERPRSE